MSGKRLDFDPDGDLLLRLTYIREDSNEDSEQLTGSLADMALERAGSTDIAHSSSSKNEVRMLVSSKHLRLASPVFSAMFNPQHFQEGKLLKENSSEGLVEVELPDDEPETFEILMNIIHGRAHRVPQEISFETLTKLAILVDKYRMVEPTIPYVQIWLTERRTNLKREKNFSLNAVLPGLCVAWVFKLPDAFKTTTATFIRESQYRPDGEGLPLPDHVLDAIESQRLQGLSTLFDAIGRAYNGESDETMSKRVSGTQFMLMKALRKQGLWPLPQAPYEGHSIANCFCLLKIAAREHDKLSHPSSQVDMWPARFVKTFLNDAAEQVWRNGAGLDLVSIRNGPQRAAGGRKKSRSRS